MRFTSVRKENHAMRNIRFFVVSLMFMSALFLHISPAQDASQWELPDGAKARLGNGKLTGNMAYSPDGTRLAVASSIGIWLYDVGTGAEVSLLGAPTHPKTAWPVFVVFSPDGDTLASGNLVRTTQLWDASTGELLHGIEDVANVVSVAFSPDGRVLATGGDKTIRLWEVRNGKHLRTLEGHKNWVRTVEFSPDGLTLISGSASGLIFLWDTRNWEHKRTLEGHQDGVVSVAFLPDGLTIASWGEDSKIRLWNARTGENRKTFFLNVHTNDIRAGAFSHDGLTFAIGSSEPAVQLWNVRTGEQILAVKGLKYQAGSIAFAPDGSTIVGAARYGGPIWMWNTSNGKHMRTFYGQTNVVEDMAFSSDGRLLASAGGGWDDYIIRLWDTRTGKICRILEGHTSYVLAVAFAPDSLILASGSNDNIVRLWDADTGAHLHTLEGHTKWISSLAFSPDGLTLASGSGDGTIRLWDGRTGEGRPPLEGHRARVTTVAFAPDGFTLASGSGVDDVRLWNTQTGELLHTLWGHHNDVVSVAFSPDGYTLVSGSFEGAIRVWDPRSGEEMMRLGSVVGQKPPPEKESLRVISAAISPDGLTIASGHWGKMVRLWDSRTGGVLRTIEGHRALVSDVMFSPDGRTLATGSGDGTILLWELAQDTNSTDLTWADVNQDGKVDIFDLVLVAAHFGERVRNRADINEDGKVNLLDFIMFAVAFGQAAPSIHPEAVETLVAADVQQWLEDVKALEVEDPRLKRGIAVLEELLTEFEARSPVPSETALLPNYPNPFNPETWIPYQLGRPSEVVLKIYDTNGQTVRTLAVGYQPPGVYRSRERAAYWDGRNQYGEFVTSGVYFCTMKAGDFTAARRMLISK